MEVDDIPDYFFKRALNLAEDAYTNDEVPVGCIICEIEGASGNEKISRIIGDGQNKITELEDPTAHAEMFAIRAACTSQKSERLQRCILITTLEPCIMCTGALILTRIDAVFYLAPLDTMGFRSILAISGSSEKPLNHHPQFTCVESWSNVSAKLLRDFFNQKRNRNRKTEYFG